MNDLERIAWINKLRLAFAFIAAIGIVVSVLIGVLIGYMIWGAP